MRKDNTHLVFVVVVVVNLILFIFFFIGVSVRRSEGWISKYRRDIVKTPLL